MEKVPKKKRGSAFKKKTILLLLLACAAAAGAGVFFLRPAPVVPALPEDAERVMLLNRPREEISAIAFSPREGAAYTLLHQGDTFVLDGEPDSVLREIALEELLFTLGELPAEAVLTEHLSRVQGVTLSDFGLSPALTQITVSYTDGESKALLLGGRAPDEEKPQYYCMLQGDDRLFTILEADAQPLLREMDSFRDFAQPKLDASLLDRIEITGDINWALRYTPSGWQMEAPFSYPLSTVRTDALLKKIESMAFASCFGNGERLNLSDYGLDAPALTVKLTQAASVISGETTDGEAVSLPVPEKEYSLLIGNETGKSGVYALWEGQVFKASNFRLGFWKELNIQDYLLQTPINLLVNDLTEVSFTYGGKTSVYEVRMVESVTENNQIATDEYCRVLYDCAVRRAGEKTDMDAEAFLSWYTRLSTLTGAGKLTEKFDFSAPSRGSVTLKNDHLTRTIEFYPWDALHDVFAVDGAALYYIQKEWLDGLADAP